MTAKYVHNGKTVWLGDIYSNTYSKSFTVTDIGVYTVTLYARSYPESDARSESGSKSATFYVYNRNKQANLNETHLLSVPELFVTIPITIKANYTEQYYTSGSNVSYVCRDLWVDKILCLRAKEADIPYDHAQFLQWISEYRSTVESASNKDDFLAYAAGTPYKSDASVSGTSLFLCR